MKQIIKKIPIISSLARNIYRKRTVSPKPFPGSERYWIERYSSGRNSGDGSYGMLAEFKAEIINGFVLQNNINKIIEYGCGDGAQLKLAEYPSYLGFDVSPEAVSICKEAFLNDTRKSFKIMDDYNNETAELTLSLDVIYHLIEDDVFSEYMNKIFNSSERFVIIYSSNTDANLEDQAAHVKHRKITQWINDFKSEWRLLRHIPNRHPFNGDTKIGSFADFFIYERA